MAFAKKFPKRSDSALISLLLCVFYEAFFLLANLLPQQRSNRRDRLWIVSKSLPHDVDGLPGLSAPLAQPSLDELPLRLNRNNKSANDVDKKSFITRGQV